MEIQNSDTSRFLSTGVPGLDTILGGGLTSDRLFLIEGEPGTGKTTLALQFLYEGVRRGESVIYITLAETRVELKAVAQSHGWSMDGIHVEDIIPNENILHPDHQFTIFHPSEIEMGMTTQRILDTIEKYKPTRVVLDSLSELQLLAESPLRYRRQVLALKQYLSGKGCTTLFLDDRTALSGDLQVRSVAHGVITLELINQDYGSERRRVRIVKYRGIAFRGGSHDYKIVTGGLVVFPRLIAAHTRVHTERKRLSSGIAQLDALTGGGLDEGTSTLLSGPPGTGKSSLCAQYVYAATQRGQKAAMFLFEEAANNLLLRSTGLGIDLEGAIDNGLLTIKQIDPAEMAPGEFMQAVTDAEAGGARVIVIDSLNGFLNAMPDERFLATHMHELLTYLGQRGVVTILVGVQPGLIGGSMSTTVDASYIADSVIMLRYFEARGKVRQAISVFKKRVGLHERTIRLFSISSKGIEVGEVLTNFHGILTGVPTFDDNQSHVLFDDDNG
ncbi:ATPase domain-containing protein [Massilia genomosp. 1]|uniref:non-specific serine/threonine protein kinase n=1 Tax=Massilia genomosp. 1 TaxID=2609280 RepID=A0ABX0MT83_9BURK|nr:ATPase domain-containing protein [Massilia genomosp. 1]NHZ62647.1 AAA family ATPase [Massilia genomosp. 1]